jgi:hypothetical protein
MARVFLGKKAQIADTMTWVVATMIIVLVMGISIFVANLIPSTKKTILLEDKEKDFLAAKSITSFLRNGENVALFENSENAKALDFLQKISAGEATNPGGWNLIIDDEEGERKIASYDIIGAYSTGTGVPAFRTNLNSDKMKLKFWKECQGGCIR